VSEHNVDPYDGVEKHGFILGCQGTKAVPCCMNQLSFTVHKNLTEDQLNVLKGKVYEVWKSINTPL